MQPNQPNNNEKGIATANQSQDQGRQGIQNLSEINFGEYFGFKEITVTLDENEAWVLKGHVMPYGKGARKLAAMLGVEFLAPEKIFVEGAWHSNPYMVMEHGNPVGVYVVKHGIAVADNGIRYLQPNLDYINVNALIAKMAMNAFDKVSGVSADGAKYCTKEVFDKMKATWTKPGDAGWFYVPTIDADTGIAFNLSEKGDAGTHIRKLQTDINQFQGTPLRKIQTATDRLVFEKLFPEVLSSLNKKTLKIGSYNKIEHSEWTIRIPTERPIARALITELGIAMRDNDDQARERKFGAIVKALGGNMPTINAIAPTPLEPDDFIDGDQITVTPEQKLRPCPSKPSNKEFAEYYKTEFRKLNDAQKQVILGASGFTNWTDYKLNKDNKDKIMQCFMDFAGIEPVQENKTMANDARKHMLEWLAEGDGKIEPLDSILKKHDFTIDTNFDLIPDPDMEKIYSEFLDQINAQE